MSRWMRVAVAGGATALVVALGWSALGSPALEWSAPGRSALTVTRAGDPDRLLPPVAGTFEYQLGGAFAPDSSARIVSRDRTDAPAPGVYNICYLNAFQTQPGADWPESLVLHSADGERLADPNWPDEFILDTSTGDKRAAIARRVGVWIDGCAEAGSDAVEPDNLDSWQRSNGLLSEADDLALARLIVAHAHARGLAVAQKNAAELPEAAREKIGFDFAIAEECEVYTECGLYTAAYGGHVIEVEYTEEAFAAACAARSGEISIILRDLDVVPRGAEGYRAETC